MLILSVLMLFWRLCRVRFRKYWQIWPILNSENRKMAISGYQILAILVHVHSKLGNFSPTMPIAPDEMNEKWPILALFTDGK